MIRSHKGKKRCFEPLRKTLAERAELAYHLRDAKGTPDLTRAYAAGEAHAYAVAEEDVRAAEAASAQEGGP